MVLADGLVISDVISDRKGITQWHDGQFEQSGRVVYSALNDLELKNNLWSEVRHETGLNGLARTPNTFEDAQTLDEKIPRSGTRYIAGVFLMLIYSDVWTVSRVVILWTQKNYFFATRVLACRWLTNKWINESLFLVIRVFNFLSLKNKKKEYWPWWTNRVAVSRQPMRFFLFFYIERNWRKRLRFPRKNKPNRLIKNWAYFEHNESSLI